MRKRNFSPRFQCCGQDAGSTFPVHAKQEVWHGSWWIGAPRARQASSLVKKLTDRRLQWTSRDWNGTEADVSAIPQVPCRLRGRRNLRRITACCPACRRRILPPIQYPNEDETVAATGTEEGNHAGKVEEEPTVPDVAETISDVVIEIVHWTDYQGQPLEPFETKRPWKMTLCRCRTARTRTQTRVTRNLVGATARKGARQGGQQKRSRARSEKAH